MGIPRFSLLGKRSNCYVYNSIFISRLRMLNGIREQFVHDESEWHRNVVGYREWNGVNDKRATPIGTA
jgi:hypothetical protein